MDLVGTGIWCAVRTCSATFSINSALVPAENLLWHTGLPHWNSGIALLLLSGLDRFAEVANGFEAGIDLFDRRTNRPWLVHDDQSTHDHGPEDLAHVDQVGDDPHQGDG